MISKRLRRALTVPLLAATVLVAVDLDAGPAAAAPGDLDVTFGGDGTVTTAAGGDSYANDVAIQADGKIVVAGAGELGNEFDDGTFLVARYNLNGSLDTSFGGGDGIVKTTFIGGGDRAEGVVVQPDGRIVVAGWARGFEEEEVFAVARYNADGSLDGTFGGDGKVTTNFPAGEAQTQRSRANAVALQSDGRIVVVGETTNGVSRVMATARYNRDGSLDTGFGREGVMTTRFSGNDVAYAVVVAGTRIVLAGTDGSRFALAAYTGAGVPDTSFNGNGTQLTPFTGDAEARGIAVQPDGRFVVAGTMAFDDFALARYNVNGTLDRTFAGDGTTTTDFGSQDVADDVMVQADGGIVAVGSSGTFDPVSIVGSLAAVPFNYEFALARYTPGGTLDATFSGDGMLTTDIGPAGDGAAAGALQLDGKIVAVGASGDDIGLARYVAASNLTLSISDVTVNEGNAGFVQATFAVSLSAPPGPSPVTVGFATANGTAQAPADYEAANGTVVFSAGQTVRTIVVQVRGDTLAEPDEVLFVNLSAPVGATLVHAQGIATIANDDVAPVFSRASVDDVVVVEGDDASVDAVFTVSLVPPAGTAGATVSFATFDDSATSPADYERTVGDLSFGPGEAAKTFSVEVSGDQVDEATERFSVVLTSAVNATLEDTEGFGKISDDEALVIDTLAGGPALVDRVVVRGGSSAVQVARLCTDPRQSPCIDLTALSAGANPRTLEGTTFETIDGAGLTAAGSVVSAGGLVAEPTLEIRLGRAVPAVEVTLRQEDAPSATVEAFLTDGTSAGVASRVAGPGVVETLRLPRTPAAEVAQQPFGLAVAGAHVYVADPANHLLRFLDPSAAVAGCPCESVLAGNGALGATDNGADPLLTQVAGAYAVAVKPLGGDLVEAYVADTFGHRVLRITPRAGSTSPTPGAVVTVLAGTGAFGFGGDNGPGPAAALNSPYGVAVDVARDIVYVADTLNNRIRAIRGDGTIDTVAGTGAAGSSGDGGPARSATLTGPRGLAVDAAGNLFIADTGSHAVRRLDPTSGVLTRVAGTGTPGLDGDGGAATDARLASPAGVALDGASVLIADTGNHRVRRVSGGGITTVVGTGTEGGEGDGGAAASAQLSSPFGVAVGPAGEMLIADTGNNRIRRVTAGTISTLAGNGSPSYAGSGVPARLAQLAGTAAVATWRASAAVEPGVSSSTFVADTFTHTVRRIDQDGRITTLAGNGSPGRGGDGGPATAAQLDHPFGVALDRASPPTAVFVADTLNQVVRRIDLVTGAITTVAGGGTGGDGPALAARLTFPTGVAVDVAGSLYIADAYAALVRRVDPGGTMTTVAGSGVLGGAGDGGPGAAAQLFVPTSVAADGANPPTLLIADSYNNRVRRLAPDGTISAFAGNGAAASGGDGGPPGNGSFNRPFGVGLDAGVPPSLSVTEVLGNRIRKVGGPGNSLSAKAAVGTPGHRGDFGPAVAALISGARGVGPVIRDRLTLLGDTFGWRVRRLGPPITRVMPDPVRFQVTAASIGCTTTCPQEVVTVSNRGLATMDIQSAVLGGPHPGDYRVVADRCTGRKLPPGAACTFRVTFVPTAVCPTGGACRQALVVLESNAADSTREIDLQGAVVTQPVRVTTTASPSGTSLPAGTPATDSATVSGPPGQPVPTGRVTFFLCGPAQVTLAGCPTGGAQIGVPVPLAGGSATSATTASAGVATTAPGMYCWRAAYSGDGIYQSASHTNALTVAAGETPECFRVRVDPTVSIASTPSGTLLVAGPLATGRATVSGAPGMPPPTGSVTFFLCGPAQVTPSGCPAGGAQIGAPVPLAGGTATSATTASAAAPGTYCWRAVYSGDDLYQPRSHTNALTVATGETPACFRVRPAPTIFVPTVSTESTPSGLVFRTFPNRSVSVTDLARVSGPPASGVAQPVPDGTVTFWLCGPDQSTVPDCSTGGTRIGGPVTLTSGPVSLDPLTARSQAVVLEAPLSGRDYYCWRAEYSGDGNFLPVSHTNRLLLGTFPEPTPECFAVEIQAPITINPSGGSGGISTVREPGLPETPLRAI